MGKRLIIFFFIVSVILLAQKAHSAYECEQISDPKSRETCLINKLSQLNQTASTLKSEINYMDTQVNLTLLRIQQTEEKINNTEKEIEALGSRIEGLDTSLNYLSKLLIKRVAEGYKHRAVSLFNIIFDTTNAKSLIDKIKYLKTTQDNNQKILVQVQEAKLNFEEQKKLREEKIRQLDDLKITLANQRDNLKNQQQAKKNLLTATNNDEATYQSLLEKARKELSGFSAFTQSAGGGIISFGNGSNGWYYTQRDPAWGNQTLPGSSYSLMTAGCAVTSVAMVCKSYGQNITPSTIASNNSNFIGGDLWNWAFSCSGKSTDWIGASYDQTKSYAKQSVPVILRLNEPSVSGLHFIVVFAWDDGKQDFKVHDPYYGPDKYFSERYSWSQVTQAIVIH